MAKEKIKKTLLMVLLILFYAILAVGSGKVTTGIETYNRGDYEKAFKQLDKSTDDHDSIKYWYMALCKESLGDYEQANLYKQKAYENLSKYNSEQQYVRENYPNEYEEMFYFGQQIRSQVFQDTKKVNINWLITYGAAHSGELVRIDNCRIHSIEGNSYCYITDGSSSMVMSLYNCNTNFYNYAENHRYISIVGNVYKDSNLMEGCHVTLQDYQ